MAKTTSHWSGPGRTAQCPQGLAEGQSDGWRLEPLLLAVLTSLWNYGQPVQAVVSDHSFLPSISSILCVHLPQLQSQTIQPLFFFLQECLLRAVFLLSMDMKMNRKN